MSKHQPTARQKNILRAISKGLRNGTIKSRWSWFTMPSDDGGLVLEITSGFPNAKELGMSRQDLCDFEQWGFLSVTGKGRSYNVNEQAIHIYCQNNL